MAATQTERILTTTYDGRKLMLLTIANPVLSSGSAEYSINGLEEVLEVVGPMFTATPQLSGVVLEWASMKSPTVNVQKGVKLYVAAQSPTSNLTAWTAGTTAQVSGVTMNILVTGH